MLIGWNRGHFFLTFSNRPGQNHLKHRARLYIDLFGNRLQFPQIERIQVEGLTVLVVAFVVTVDWLRCEAKYRSLLGGNDDVLSGRKHVVDFLDFSQTERRYYRLATAFISPRNANNPTVTTNATTKTIQRSTWIRCMRRKKETEWKLETKILNLTEQKIISVENRSKNFIRHLRLCDETHSWRPATAISVSLVSSNRLITSNPDYKEDIYI